MENLSEPILSSCKNCGSPVKIQRSSYGEWNMWLDGYKCNSCNFTEGTMYKDESGNKVQVTHNETFIK